MRNAGLSGKDCSPCPAKQGELQRGDVACEQAYLAPSPFNEAGGQDSLLATEKGRNFQIPRRETGY